MHVVQIHVQWEMAHEGANADVKFSCLAMIVLGLLGSTAVLAIAAAAGKAATKSYPTEKTIKIISPFSAGSPPTRSAGWSLSS